MTNKPTIAAAIAAGALALGLLVAGAASAQTAGGDKAAKNRGADAFAQTRPQSRRARTRVRVYPIYPRRLESTRFPPPDPSEYRYPGPGHVRECVAWLAPQYRPSGTVIVPHTRCWCQPG